MWNLLNFLQLVNLIPLMSLRLPENVLTMFKYFAFANAESEILQN